jgi:uncharacterized protein YndB with AHSA1/START domain/predicted enzyme related to lactoylglutathione lyase
MFETIKPYSSFSIKDPIATKAFYSDVLGLNVSEETMAEGERMLTLNLDGGGKILMYPKPDHVPATFTVLNLPVKEIHSAVKDLNERGIKFEHYEGNDGEEINHNCGPSIAWFKDPSGNFLSVMEVQHQFTTTRFFAVTREKLFNFFTDKNLIEKWAYPDGMILRVPKFEARTDGEYRFEHTNKEGVWVCTGSVKEFIPNQKLVQEDTVRGPDGKLMFEKLEAITEFKDVRDGTEVSITQRGFENQDDLDGCKIGWEQSLKHLGTLLQQ